MRLGAQQPVLRYNTKRRRTQRLSYLPTKNFPAPTPTADRSVHGNISPDLGCMYAHCTVGIVQSSINSPQTFMMNPNLIINIFTAPTCQDYRLETKS
ncbi:hypothetical protein O181_004204 [Austropuccinia psidii MF-1]|uniref:Uncharacterized protein n=1 Tax=Austropuccinia psidii MF-1 TaxID=1389203 RepID=A0A9Q3BFF3_9BASI|nr:hypothetical protein [Austropuccinia psidii MF-1]